MQNTEGNTATAPEIKPQKRRISKAALFSFLVSFFSFGLFPIAAWLAIGLGFLALVNIKRSEGMLKGKVFAYFGIIPPSILIAFLFTVSFDAPPIEDDWTIDNLRSVKAENIESYDILLRLADGESDPNGTAIGLSQKDTTLLNKIVHTIRDSDWQYAVMAESVRANSDHIEQLWNKAQKGRAIIESLYRYDEIADLTKPDIDATFGYIANQRRLSLLYYTYACLQIEQGNDEIAINELIKIDSVFRKLNINCRNMISRFVCQYALSLNIKTANLITNKPDVPLRSLDILGSHFSPLQKEIASPENVIIAEYLMLKDMIDVKFYEDMSKEDEDKMRRHWMLKRNSSLRLFRNHCETIISLASNTNDQTPPYQCVWPEFYPIRPNIRIPLDDSDNLHFFVPWYYYIYNPIGTLQSVIFLTNGKSIIDSKTRLQIQDDLFQIVIAMRLGKKYDLTARAYGGEYIVDVENKIIFSPGPDEEAYTKDDISLPINPEVLGLVGTKTKIQEIAALKARATDCWDKRKANIAKLKKLTQQREKMLFGGMITSKGKKLFAETDVVLNEMIANGNEVVRCLTKLEEMGVDFSELECASYVEDKPLPAGMPGMPMPGMPGMPSK